MTNTRRPTRAETKRTRVEAARAAVARAQRRSRNLRIGLWSAAAVVAVAVVVAAVVVLNRPNAPQPVTAAPKLVPSAQGRTGNPPWEAPADASAGQVSLAADHIGGLAADSAHQLKTYVNGKPYAGNPTGIVLAAHDEIAIAYGTQAQQTNVPSTYRWTNGP